MPKRMSVKVWINRDARLWVKSHLSNKKVNLNKIIMENIYSKELRERLLKALNVEFSAKPPSENFKDGSTWYAIKVNITSGKTGEEFIASYPHKMIHDVDILGCSDEEFEKTLKYIVWDFIAFSKAFRAIRKQKDSILPIIHSLLGRVTEYPHTEDIKENNV